MAEEKRLTTGVGSPLVAQDWQIFEKPSQVNRERISDSVVLDSNSPTERSEHHERR